MNNQEIKKQLRRSVRSMYPGDDIKEMESARICEHLLQCNEFNQAVTVVAYVPMKHEANITHILYDTIATGKMLLLPRVENDTDMTLRKVSSLNDLIPGMYGILEPTPDTAVISPDMADIILVPLEAVDRYGMRLGKGKGYYDHLLSSTHAYSIGVALSHQMIDTVPSDPWDQPLDAVVAANGIVRFKTLKG